MKLLPWTAVLLIIINAGKAKVLQQQVFCPEQCFCPPNREISCYKINLSEVPTFDDEDNNFVSYDLSGNHIEQVPEKSFENLGKIKFLDLRSNGLRSIDELGFYGLDNLHKLQLDNNSLTSLHRGSFQLLLSLQTLTLSRNPLDISNPIPFSTTLKKLDINHCKLQTIHPDFLAGVKYLQELDLTHNLLASLPVDFFINLPKLNRLHLHGNSWRCDVMEDLLLSKQDVIADYKQMQCVTSDGEYRALSWKQTQTTRVSSASSETSSQGPRATSPKVPDEDISVSSTVIVYIYGAVICILLITCVVVGFLLRLSIMDCFNKLQDRTSTVDLRGSGESGRSSLEPLYCSIVDISRSSKGT